jgi:hypothetical protein
MNNLVTFRPRTVWLYAGIVAVIVLSLVIQTIATQGIKADLVVIAWGTFIMSGTYLLFVHPKVEIFDEGITITNPLQKITVGWQRVETIDAKYTMSIQVGGKVIYAWAAPAPGRYHSRSVHAADIKGMDIGFEGEIRAGESPRSQSGQASYIAKLRLKEFEASGIEGCESSLEINYIGAALVIGSLVIALSLYTFNF